MRGLVVVVLFGACGSSPPAPSAPLSSSATIVVLDRAPADAVALPGAGGTTVTASDGTTRTVDERFVEESLLAPTAFLLQGYPPSMPSFDGQLQPREIAALTAFIKSLK